jgi:hypothetical protein
VTELDRPERISETAKSPEPEVNPVTYIKGDVLHPEWGERPPWFGYIGVGIALAAMLVGLALMVVVGGYAWRWIGS